ncbi:glucose-6-phosphate dehydrogenase assembly protein OpcA [Sorangium sp. So ce131]|uniref:glucose-6-phosphate dehydrogenase assembly protein OpcA n=1 Tax=Sorangium sp. So ce131 TaxID=3133282 RepID=UPI003F611E6C
MSAGPIAEVIKRVESELAAFWASPDDSRDKPAVKTRASTMNFVAVGSRAEVERLKEQAQALAETHAGRTLLITIDDRLDPLCVQADWSAMCRRDGEVPICYDSVELSFGVAAAERVASVVSALTISDVTVIVELAPGAPNVLGDALAPVCDRLVFDSAETCIERLAAVARETKAPLADRAFVRTFSFRELVARFFDDMPEACRSIRRVEIARSAGSKPDPAALFLGWMGSRLGWTFEARGPAQAGGPAAVVGRARAADGAPIEIALVDGPPADEQAARRIDGVRLETSLGGKPLALGCVRLEKAPATVRWTMEGARSAEHLHPLGYRDETWVLTKTIDSLEGDRLLRDAVLAAASWSALGGGPR